MGWITINNTGKYCAICKYWWDPACSYIQPQQAKVWRIEGTTKCRCVKRNIDTQGQAFCEMFRCKSVLNDL